MAQTKRLTAVKSRIEPVVEGTFQSSEGFDPSYVITSDGKKVSRVRVMGTVMKKFRSEDGNYGFLVIDDETETIRAKFFQETDRIEEVEVGDLVDVIGKVRQYEGELYINPEVVREIDDPNMLVLRNAELALQDAERDEVREEIEELREQLDDPEEVRRAAIGRGIDPETVNSVLSSGREGDGDDEGKKERVLEVIDDMDDGEGVEYSEVMEQMDMPEEEIEPVINELLAEGTCYEPRPGKVKKL